MEEKKKFRVYNEITNCLSGWMNSEMEMLKYCARDFALAVGLSVHSMSVEYAPLAMKCSENDNSVIMVGTPSRLDPDKIIRVPYCGALTKFLLVKDQYGRIVTPYSLETVGYDNSTGYFYLQPWMTEERVWNPKKRLREKDNGYRKEPVSRTGRNLHRIYGRSIRYKDTQIARTDPECKEYRIEGYRARKVVDPWLIEPFREGSRSWKDTKCQRQYMRHWRQSA